MSIYITQGRYSGQAIKGMVGKPEDREPEIRKLVEAVGGKLLAYYMTMGEYDFLIIIEGQGEEDILSALLVAAASGGVTDLKTVQAFTTTTGKKAFERAGQIAAGFRPAGS
ncbi:MAG: GYD domain-containing protein [Hyphomicrobiales bacterium]|nr:GYD domain-containing protein [Hyphomicrobiales bacterium]